MELAKSRLSNQQIDGTRFTSVREIVGWMGAMQAQDYAMVKWAIGLRLPNSTDQTIEAAISEGEIIRTHVLRPTWHMVAAEDLRWILDLTAPQIKATLRSRHRELGLSESLVAKSNAVIEEALSDGSHLTRSAIVEELKNNGIATDENRASHLLLAAELEGIACSGALSGIHQTYALLEKRIMKTSRISRGEALVRLARRYFSSHGPASLQDFGWWSGLSMTEARRALEMVKPELISEIIGAQTYWFADSISRAGAQDVYLLPAFDEYIISYKDRSAVLPAQNFKQAVSENGIFRPVIVVNGQVAGLWKRTIKKDKVFVALEFFTQPDQVTRLQTQEAAFRYGLFLEKETIIN